MSKKSSDPQGPEEKEITCSMKEWLIRAKNEQRKHYPPRESAQQLKSYSA